MVSWNDFIPSGPRRAFPAVLELCSTPTLAARHGNFEMRESWAPGADQNSPGHDA